MEEQTNQQKEYACWCKEINEEMAKLGRMFSNIGPSNEVKSHFRNARVEFLKGMRQMIDEKIERAQGGPSHGASVPVE